MSERMYLFFLGIILLFGLYIDSDLIVYLIVAIMFVEGISGVTIPEITQKLRGISLDLGLLKLAKSPKFDFKATLIFRLLMGLVVLSSYAVVHEYNVEALWFFPWFISFAVLGAGVSGVCPVYLAIRWCGFK